MGEGPKVCGLERRFGLRVTTELGERSALALSAGMIQFTSRLSRGARLRRERPLWPYGLAAVMVIVVLGAVWLLTP